MFSSVLIANRGEIAVRIIRTLRRLGIGSIAVFSDADATARHVGEADTAVRIGPAPARDSYLHIGRVIDAAITSGAEAIHPGYGFLSENAAFARACAEAGITFVGPSPQAIEIMGDKIRAKQAVSRAGVPVVAGTAEPGLTDAQLTEAAATIGYPLLIKPSAGGGGKGMHLVEGRSGLAQALGQARREAAAAFGDDTLFLERFVSNPRHIEVQVLADTAGHTVHLAERECSLQRRHQKIVEEAPSVLLDEETRDRIGASACSTASAVGYVGAGTVEFIVGGDRPDEFFFMEMNTRLQVEHPVTEAVTGLDLVEQQLRVAAGGALGFSQSDVRLHGHAIEARIYAEDPARGFLPTGGTAHLVREPSGEGIRTDSAMVEGVQVGTDYDPMLAKVIAWGPDRDAAIARMERALADTTVLGFTTNVGFLRRLIGHPDVRAGRLDTGLIDRDLDHLTQRQPPPVVPAAYGMLVLRELERRRRDSRMGPWDVPNGWRLAGPRPLRRLVSVSGGDPVRVEVTRVAGTALVRVGEAEPAPAPARLFDRGGRTVMELAGSTHQLDAFDAGESWWISLDGDTWQVTPVATERGAVAAAAADRDIVSPMPGTVLAVNLGTGDSVRAGQAVLVIEAMKMEHTLAATVAGRIEVLVAAGDQVRLDQVVARVVEDGAEADGAEEQTEE